MAGENLWYLKRNDVVTGPFPQAMLERNMILGRVTRDDLICQDRNHWVAAGRTVEFKTVYIAPLDSSVFVEADERQTERRNKTKDTQAEKLRLRRADRRVVEPDLLLNRRSRSYQIWRGLDKTAAEQKFGSLGLVLAFIVITTIGISFKTTPQHVELGKCSSAPAAGIDWESCSRPRSNLRNADLRGAILRNADLFSSDLAGADLVEADLSYADMRQVNFELAELTSAKLVGANLQSANLAHANLRSADLQFANLRDAELDGVDLSGAFLDNAIWSNGERCRAASVGVCRLD